MLPAIAVVASLVLATGGTVRPRSSTVTSPHLALVNTAASVVSTFDAESDFTITTARWVTHSIGVGLGNQTLTLLVDGVSACTITVACLAAAGTEATVSCNVDVSTGQDVDWTRSGCATANLGAISYLVSH